MKEMLAKQTTKRYMTFLSLVLVFVVILSTEARAELFGFKAISNNSGVSGTLAEQLCVDVTGNDDDDEVFFTFYNNYNPDTASAFNNPPVESIVTATYFADGSLFVENSGQVYDTSTTGVSFSLGASPPTLPYKKDVWTTFFAADSDSPVSHNGVNEWPLSSDPEYVTISFSLLTNIDLDDVLYGINNPYSADGLLIGLHVQSIGGEDGDSDWFVTPVPGAAILGLLGLGVAGIKLRKYA